MFLRVHWKDHGEGGATAIFASDRNVATHQSGKLLAYREPETGSLSVATLWIMSAYGPPRYYGIEGVTSNTLQKVALDRKYNRGGVLTQGAILKVTAKISDQCTLDTLYVPESDLYSPKTASALP